MKEVNHRVAAGHQHGTATAKRCPQTPGPPKSHLEWQCPHAQAQRGQGSLAVPPGREERPGMAQAGDWITHIHTVP